MYDPAISKERTLPASHDPDILLRAASELLRLAETAPENTAEELRWLAARLQAVPAPAQNRSGG